MNHTLFTYIDSFKKMNKKIKVLLHTQGMFQHKQVGRNRAVSPLK